MFCIMRTEKRKRTDLGGIQKENTRTATEYNNKVSPGMDILNVTLRESNNWLRDIDNEIKTAEIWKRLKNFWKWDSRTGLQRLTGNGMALNWNRDNLE